MPIYAQPTQDENLVPGWNAQGNSSPGYAEAGVTGTVTNVGQAGAGFPQPAGAMNANPNENSASYGESVLENGSYSVTPTTNLSVTPATAPIPTTTTAVQNPYGMNATVTLTCGATATTVQVAPFTTGTPSYGPAIALTASAVTQVSVPPGGFLKAAAAGDITAATWTPTN